MGCPENYGGSSSIHTHPQLQILQADNSARNVNVNLKYLKLKSHSGVENNSEDTQGPV